MAEKRKLTNEEQRQSMVDAYTGKPTKPILQGFSAPSIPLTQPIPEQVDPEQAIRQALMEKVLQAAYAQNSGPAPTPTPSPAPQTFPAIDQTESYPNDELTQMKIQALQKLRNRQ